MIKNLLSYPALLAISTRARALVPIKSSALFIGAARDLDELHATTPSWTVGSAALNSSAGSESDRAINAHANSE